MNMGKKKPGNTRAVISQVNAIYHHVTVILTGPQETCRGRLLMYERKNIVLAATRMLT
jgi:hypothetical protein